MGNISIQLDSEYDRLLVLKNIILFAVIELKMTKLIVSAFEIFDHGNVIIDFFRFVHGYLQSNNTIGNRNKKFIENFVIQRKKVENGETNFGLIGNYDWINSITDQILHHLLTNSHKYQLHLLMKCLSQVKYNENYRIYFIFANLLGDVNSFDFETFQKSPKEICNNFLEKNEFGKARKVYQAINKPLTPIIIHQIEFILSENKQSWNQTSEYHHKQIFQRCFDLLNKYSSNYFVNAVFFLQKLHLFQSTIQASEIQQLLEYFLFFIQKFHSKNFQSSNSPFINRIERDIQMRITIFKAIQKNSSLKIPRLIIKILAEDFPFEKKIEENPPVLLNNEELPFYFLGDIFVKQNDIENEMIIVKQIIEYLIDENQVKQAEEICQEISCSLADLVVIKACERIALCSQDEYVENLLITEFPEVMSLVEKAYPHLDFSLITTDELLEKLKDLPNHGKKYCRKISTVYHVSLLVSRDFFVVEQAPELALQLLMRKSSNYSNEISRFSNDVGLSCTRLATIFADLYFESLIFRREIMGILLEKEMKEESPDSKDENKYQEIDQIYSKELNIEIKTEKNILRGVVSATHTTQEFIRFAQITGELLTFTNVLMRNLLNFISQKHENFDHKSEIEVEILIKCLECFRISCDMNGMKNNIKLIKKRLPIYIREQKHQLLYWIFQEYDLPQLDFLLHFFIEEKKLKKIVPFSSNFSNSFSIRASRYLQKKFSREPKLILNFYLHFSMKKEIGHFLSNEARLLLNQIKFPQISEQDPLTIFVSVQDIQKMVEARSILLFSSHAFLHTEFQQKLIQNFILDDLISIQILVGDLQMINIKKSKKKDLQILMQKAPDFYTSLVISEFYKLNSLENWSKALFHHFFVEKDSRFLSEYFSYFILDEPLVKKIVELYQSFSDKNLIVHQMEVFVSFIQDIVLALKISKELRFFNLFDNLKSVLPLHLVKEVIKNEKEKK
ncbi:spatacsin [Anaeramoeba ignava]|uniref:Spatacsin n=1 Tax=Anaeramoeba ignava TaxID=1746090 RepID=A0A9Q0LR45_ANAIG|nr:spatacsin [Anaeramoeba ignava]